MTSLLTELPSTLFAIVMPDEFSEVTDITVDRRNSTSINPMTQSVIPGAKKFLQLENSDEKHGGNP